MKFHYQISHNSIYSTLLCNSHNCGGDIKEYYSVCLKSYKRFYQDRSSCSNSDESVDLNSSYMSFLLYYLNRLLVLDTWGNQSMYVYFLSWENFARKNKHK